MACGILVLRPGIEPTAPALEARSLNHWTARGVLPMPSSMLLPVNCPWSPALTAAGSFSFTSLRPTGLMFSMALQALWKSSAIFAPRAGKSRFLKAAVLFAETSAVMLWLEFGHILGGSFRIWGVGHPSQGFQRSSLDFIIFLPHSNLGLG